MANVLPQTDLGVAGTLDAGDLRNGAAAGLTIAARAAAIPAEFHWRWVTAADQLPIAAVPAVAAVGGAPAVAAVAAVVAGAPTAAFTAYRAANPNQFWNVTIGALFRSYFASLVEAAVPAAWVAGGAAPDPRIAARIDPALRRRAIILAFARISITRHWGIAENEVSASETANANGITIALNAPGNGFVIGFSSGHFPAAYTAWETSWAGCAALTADEKLFASVVRLLALGAPGQVGNMLVTQSHHYFGGQNKRFTTMEGQIWNGSDITAGAKTLWTANADDNRDVLWHKVCHPILSNVLMSIACDPHIAERLTHSGFGSAAVGLPARVSEERAASSYIAVIDQIAPLARNDGHTINVAGIRQAVTLTSAFPAMNAPNSGVVAAQVVAAGQVGNIAIPAGVTNKATAVSLVLLPAMEAAAPAVAFLFGYMQGMFRDLDIRTATPQGSLAHSFSASKAATNNVGTYSAGMRAYEASARAARQNAQAGNITVFTFNA